MSKIDQLVEWCRTQNVIPASGTKARNDLADLVMGQPIEDVKKAFSTFRDEPDSVKRWKWLIANVCDMDSFDDLLNRTVLSYRWYLLQKEHEEEITKGWAEINTANREIASKLREIDARELRMTATVKRLADAEEELQDKYRRICDLRSEIDELRETEAECNVLRQALRHGMWNRKPLTEQRVLDQYRLAVTTICAMEAGCPPDEMPRQVDEIVSDALACLTETGMTPADLAEQASLWKWERAYEDKGEPS